MSYPVHPLRERLAPYVLGVGGLVELLTPLPGLLLAVGYFLYLLWRKRQELWQRQSTMQERPPILPQLHAVWEWCKERWQSLVAVTGVSQGLATWVGYFVLLVLLALAVSWVRDWFIRGLA